MSSNFKLSKITGGSYCEWKGKATYWALTHPNSKNTVKGKIWSYEEPTPGFKDIRGYLSFYADSGAKENGWECWVDDEKVSKATIITPKPVIGLQDVVLFEGGANGLTGTTTAWRLLRRVDDK